MGYRKVCPVLGTLCLKVSRKQNYFSSLQQCTYGEIYQNELYPRPRINEPSLLEANSGRLDGTLSK